jgi:hypothetical protein
MVKSSGESWLDTLRATSAGATCCLLGMSCQGLRCFFFFFFFCIIALHKRIIRGKKKKGVRI